MHFFAGCCCCFSSGVNYKNDDLFILTWMGTALPSDVLTEERITERRG